LDKINQQARYTENNKKTTRGEAAVYLQALSTNKMELS
jgi:hypothetical protein